MVVYKLPLFLYYLYYTTYYWTLCVVLSLAVGNNHDHHLAIIDRNTRNATKKNYKCHQRTTPTGGESIEHR